ncbi:hypothetical protein MMC31_005791 [Peltigera leucophlebia]|nr:hypothetical protein [Peltigera leucophlebia]
MSPEQEDKIAQARASLLIFIQAMQTENFTILVGPAQCAYKVPQGRLIMHSPVFERMCSAPFLESTERVIKLPEEDPVDFENFFDWMHSSKPQVDFSSKGTEAIFGLAIFAEKYQIYYLKNQISDIIRQGWEKLKLKSETLDQIYSSVPEGAVLRELCSWILQKQATQNYSYGRSAPAFFEEYEPAFISHADLGRDFFKWTLNGESKTCSFHDHSDITNPLEGKRLVCPYSDIPFVAPRSTTPPKAENRASKKQKKNP